uniref:protein phosphatase Mn(2+)-dependent 1K n=1 Tax=Myxine glutinosa TaxID=7769 RepID=UPI00358E259B
MCVLPWKGPRIGQRITRFGVHVTTCGASRLRPSLGSGTRTAVDQSRRCHVIWERHGWGRATQEYLPAFAEASLLNKVVKQIPATFMTSALCCKRDVTQTEKMKNDNQEGQSGPWDRFGIWDHRIDEPILLPPSIKYGKLIPKVSLSRIGMASRLGRRKENEDRWDLGELVQGSILYFAIFDGHGGSAAADFCSRNMQKYLEIELEKEQNLQTALHNAFLEADRHFVGQAQASGNEAWQASGSTATVALLRDGVELAVASAGDSRAILCRRGDATRLTEDHTPDRKDEEERIRRAGGFITWNSLGQPHVNGRLGMTRSIGDLPLKGAGVIPEPETKAIMLRHSVDAFLVLTTDGINLALNSQDICDVINRCHEPAEAASNVADQALQYGTDDNSTAMVIPFGAWGAYAGGGPGYPLGRTLSSSGRWA